MREERCIKLFVWMETRADMGINMYVQYSLLSIIVCVLSCPGEIYLDVVVVIK